MLPMDYIFKTPFVFEIMGGGFEKPTNCSFYIPRHPRVCKIHWDRSYLEAMSFAELQVAAMEALNVGGEDYKDMQTESQWIEKLFEKDLSAKELKRKQETMNILVKGRKAETRSKPAARTAAQTDEPLCLRDISQSITSISFRPSEAGLEASSLKRANTPASYLEADRHKSPPTKKPRLTSAPILPQVLISDFLQLRNGHSSISPLRGAIVFLPHYLMKFPKLLERITNHDVKIIHILPIAEKFGNIRSLMPTKRGVVLIESNKASLTKKTLNGLYEILKPINEGEEEGQGYGWETYDWRIVNYHQPEGTWETDWSLWHVWSVV